MKICTAEATPHLLGCAVMGCVCAGAHTHTYTHIYTPIHTHTHTHTYTRPYTHTHTHTYTHTHIHTHTHTHKSLAAGATPLLVCVQVHTRTHTHTRTRPYTHTHIHTHTHTHARVSPLGLRLCSRGVVPRGKRAGVCVYDMIYNNLYTVDIYVWRGGSLYYVCVRYIEIWIRCIYVYVPAPHANPRCMSMWGIQKYIHTYEIIGLFCRIMSFL